MKKQVLLLAFLFAFAVPSSAQGLYIFADVERNKIESDIEEFSMSKTENGYGLGLGYRVNNTLAIELAYRDMLSFNERDSYEDYEYRLDTDVTAIQISVLASYPLNEQVNIFGRLGVGRIDIDSTFYENSWGTTSREADNESATKALFGIGASYAFTENLAARLEYSRFAKIEEATLSALSVAFQYHF